ncbi:MAG: CoA transferase [Alphaproteobacteria bacterium]|nr:CoA transferase [Alphaproteobacteria bacterium]
MTKLLEGYRVLDLSQVVMGPVATQILAEFGAEVIKVEPPSGDTSRHIGPMKNPGMGYIFLHANRGKRSVVLDLKDADGLAALFKLAETADVLVSNTRAEAMDRLGLSYARLREANPRIVYVNLLGFGNEGPRAGDPAYEDLIQSLTAVPSLLMRAGADEPMFVPLAFNDRACGLACANAVLASLLARHRTGEGQHIILPMFETMAASVLADHMGGATFEPPIGPMGYQRILTDLRRPYRTQDGYVSMVLYTDKHWRAFVRIAGEEAWFAEDSRLHNLTARSTHASEIYVRVVEIMHGRSSEQWLTALHEADIPAAVVHTLESLVEDPQLAAMKVVRTSTHPSEGVLRTLEPALRFDGQAAEPLCGAPRLGEHTQEVLREAGVDEDRIGRIVSGR